MRALALSVSLVCFGFVGCSNDSGPGDAQGGTGAGGASHGGQSAMSGGISNANGGSQSGGSAQGGSSNSSGGSTASGGAGKGGAGQSGGATANGGATAQGGTTSAAQGGMTTTAHGGASAQGGGSAQGGDTGKAEVRFVGRMDRSDSKGPRFAWSGSGMVARFNGTQVSAKISSGQYTVVIDGQRQVIAGGNKEQVLVANGAMQQVATGLSAGIHTVELYRRTEANQGVSQFLGFDFGTGQLMSPPPAPTRRIEIIGDSITCGYGDEGASASCGFTPETENHYLTYGAIAARNVNAELITIAWSGKGVVCNYGDDANSCVDPMPTYYERTLPDQSNSAWDFSSWQADAVVINLGTNDFSTMQDPSQTEFETAYKALIQKIRSKYANAWILLTNGSMLGGGDLDTVRKYLTDVAKAMNDGGDTKVKTFEIAPQNASADGIGCDSHPSLTTHAKMADQLTAALKTTLGW